MKKYILIFCFFLAYVTIYSQANDFVNVLGTDLQVGNLKAYGIKSYDEKENKYTGSPLLWGEWTPGSLKLKGKEEYTQKQYEVLYDSFNRLLFVKLGSAEYNVNLEMVDSVTLQTPNGPDRNFVMLMSNEKVNDLYEILSDTESLSLLLKKDVEIEIQPYSPAFDIGSKKAKLSMKESLYFSRDGELYELPKRRKKFIQKYENTEEIKDVVSYFKETKVNFKKAEDIQSAMLGL